MGGLVPKERAFWGANGADVVVTPSSVQTPLCTKLWSFVAPLPFQAFLGSDADTRGACKDAGVPLLLRFITRFGICSSREQDFGSTAHDSEKEKGSVSAPCSPQLRALHRGLGTDRPPALGRSEFSFCTL